MTFNGFYIVTQRRLSTKSTHLLEKLLRDELRPLTVYLPGLAGVGHIGHLINEEIGFPNNERFAATQLSKTPVLV